MTALKCAPMTRVLANSSALCWVFDPSWQNWGLWMRVLEVLHDVPFLIKEQCVLSMNRCWRPMLYGSAGSLPIARLAAGKAFHSDWFQLQTADALVQISRRGSQMTG